MEGAWAWGCGAASRRSWSRRSAPRSRTTPPHQLAASDGPVSRASPSRPAAKTSGGSSQGEVLLGVLARSGRRGSKGSKRGRVDHHLPETRSSRPTDTWWQRPPQVPSGAGTISTEVPNHEDRAHRSLTPGFGWMALGHNANVRFQGLKRCYSYSQHFRCAPK